jgi:hypothetical protein
MIFGIDFTSTNGAPGLESSLHHYDPTHSTLNQYQQVITALGNILEQYDTDQYYSIYGYGAQIRYPNQREYSQVQHSFLLNTLINDNIVKSNNNNHEWESYQLQGILHTYIESMKYMKFSEPNLMCPIITSVYNQLSSTANECTQSHQKYSVLILITCGVVNDLQQTIDVIVDAAATVPLSIIIIGVGNADFTGM